MAVLGDWSRTLLPSWEVAKNPESKFYFTKGQVINGVVCKYDVGPHATYGPRSDYRPQYDVLIKVGQLTNNFVRSYPEGTKFALEAGTHRTPGNIQPRNRQQFHGLIGPNGEQAIVSGAKVLTGWINNGNGTWSVNGQTQRFEPTPETIPMPNIGDIPVCQVGTDLEMCRFHEDVSVDKIPLTQVASLSNVSGNRWHFDYNHSSGGRITIGVNPFRSDGTPKLVETNVRTHGFYGGGNDVLLKNIVVEMFATTTLPSPTVRYGAVDSNGFSRWVVEDCTIRLNHGTGIRFTSSDCRVTGSRVVHNGMIGVRWSSGARGLVETTEIGFNNHAGYAKGYEAGGTKFAFTGDFIGRYNWCHDNDGNGLWPDIQNNNVMLEWNAVENETQKGMFHEISYSGEYRYNHVRNCGSKAPIGFEAVAILAMNTQDVWVHHNEIWDCPTGIFVHDAPGRSPDQARIIVEDNITHYDPAMRWSSACAAGLGHKDTLISDRKNVFRRNTYYIKGGGTTGGSNWLVGFGVRVNWSGWQQKGYDRDGKYIAT